MRQLIGAFVLIGAAACTEQPSPQAVPDLESIAQALTEGTAEGFILKTGEGEPLLNGIVVKASPKTGTRGSILVEQAFPRGGTTNLHIHDQGDELFYVVSGRGTATLADRTEVIAPGDVIFVPRSEVHRISNLENDEPLKVVFFMDSPELVEQFRAIHERVTLEPHRPITPEERAAIAKRIGGARQIK
jgi:quercetin dioxygenase-like cupin family protein